MHERKIAAIAVAVAITVIFLLLAGMMMERSDVQYEIFHTGEYHLCCGGGKIVGHIEVEQEKVIKQWVPAGGDYFGPSN